MTAIIILKGNQIESREKVVGVKSIADIYGHIFYEVKSKDGSIMRYDSRLCDCILLKGW